MRCWRLKLPIFSGGKNILTASSFSCRGPSITGWYLNTNRPSPRLMSQYYFTTLYQNTHYKDSKARCYTPIIPTSDTLLPLYKIELLFLLSFSSKFIRLHLRCSLDQPPQKPGSHSKPHCDCTIQFLPHIKQSFEMSNQSIVRFIFLQLIFQLSSKKFMFIFQNCSPFTHPTHSPRPISMFQS